MRVRNFLAGFCLAASLAGLWVKAAVPGMPDAPRNGPAEQTSYREPEGSGTAFVMRGGGAAFLSRNLDSPAADGCLFVNQRGVVKEAFGVGREDPVRWTSKYGSVTFSQLGREFPSGGMNEAGLAVEGLAGRAACPPPDRRPAVNELQWVQYVLDTCGSIKEALKTDRALRISRLFFDLHYLVADSKGRVAVVEFEAGKMKTFAGGELPVPVLGQTGYEEALRGWLDPGSGGNPPISAGPPASPDSFSRAASVLREYAWLGQTPIVDQAFTVLRAVEHPDTRWSAVYSPRSRRLFLKTRLHRRYKILGLDSLDYACGSRTLFLPVETEAAGNLSRSLIVDDSAKNRLLLESSVRRLGESGFPMPGPVDDVIRRMSDYPQTCRCR